MGDFNQKLVRVELDATSRGIFQFHFSPNTLGGLAFPKRSSAVTRNGICFWNRDAFRGAGADSDGAPGAADFRVDGDFDFLIWKMKR